MNYFKGIGVWLMMSILLSGCGTASDKIQEAITPVEMVEEDEEAAVVARTEALLGIESNTSGVIRVVDGDFETMLLYKVREVTNVYEDEYSLVTDYICDGEAEDVITYFDELILNTEGYTKLDVPGYEGAMFQGMINGFPVYIEVNIEDGEVLIATYIDRTNKQ